MKRLDVSVASMARRICLPFRRLTWLLMFAGAAVVTAAAVDVRSSVAWDQSEQLSNPPEPQPLVVVPASAIETDTQSTTSSDAPLTSLTIDSEVGGDAESIPEWHGVPRMPNERQLSTPLFSDIADDWYCLSCAGTFVCHRPLYYEDRLLERYGLCLPIQPLFSAAHFGVNSLLLPIKYVRQPPCHCECSPCAYQ